MKIERTFANAVSYSTVEVGQCFIPVKGGGLYMKVNTSISGCCMQPICLHTGTRGDYDTTTACIVIDPTLTFEL